MGRALHSYGTPSHRLEGALSKISSRLGLASGTTARFVGGGWREVVVALAIGVTLGFWASLVGRRPRHARVFEPLAGALATVVAMVASAYLPPVSVYITTLAGLIVLIP